MSLNLLRAVIVCRVSDCVTSPNAMSPAEKLAAAPPASRSIDPFDFYRADETLLTEDERLVRDTARAFAAKELLPRLARWDAGRFDPYKSHEEAIRATARKMADTLGVFGATLPDLGRYLGAPGFEQMSHVAYGLAMREIEWADGGMRSVASVQSSLCMFPIYAYGSEEQKGKWLGPLHRGEKLACFGLTEPQGGSDPGEMRTTARKTPKGWVLNGDKAWITNGFGEVAVVWARTPEGIRGFLVEKGTPGFSYRNEEKWALRCGVASSLSFTNCEVPDDAIMPGTVQPRPQDLACALRCLSEARYGICWGVVGAARACCEEALRFSKERVLFKTPLAAKQETQRKLVRMLNETENANLVAVQLGRLKDSGRLDHVHISLAKYNNVSKALETAQLACELISADVFAFDAYHSGRHLRNLEVVKKYEGAHDIHMLVVGRAITGHSAF